MLHTMGDVYEALGLYAEAERLLRQSFELHRTTLGEAHLTTQDSVGDLGFLLHQTGRSEEAIALLEPALVLQQRTFGEEHPVVAETKGALAGAYTRVRRLADAERLSTAVVDVRTRTLGRDHANTLASLNNLAVRYQAQGKVDQALALDREVLALRRARPWRRSSADDRIVEQRRLPAGDARALRRSAPAPGGGAESRGRDLGCRSSGLRHAGP